MNKASLSAPSAAWSQNPSSGTHRFTPRAPNAGRRMNKPVKIVSATAIVPPMAPLERRSSSGTCRFADQASALNPRDNDSASIITPRTNGMRA